MNIISVFLYNPLLNLLVFFYQLFGNSLGWAIIAVSVFLRLVFIPLTQPSMKAAEKQRAIQPEIEELKKKFGSDKEKLAKAQMELMRKHGINPAAGCLPTLISLVVFITLYRVFDQFLKIDAAGISAINSILYFGSMHFPANALINLSFGPWDLAKPDPYFVLPIMAALSQFLLSKMMMPRVSAGQKEAKETPDKTDDIMYTVQNQSLYLMPLMTVVIGWNMPSGLMLVWLITSLTALGQQVWVSKRGKNERNRENKNN